jgi:invasion protein IalB
VYRVTQRFGFFISTLLFAANPVLAAAPLMERVGDWDLICRPGDAGEALPSQAASAAPPATKPTTGKPSLAKPTDVATPLAESKVDCRLIQSHALDDTKQNLLILSIVLAGKDKDKAGLAVISLPQAVYLSPGILMKVDAREPFKILYELCNPRGCHAGFQLKDPVLGAFKSGTEAKIVVWSVDNKAIEVKVSLRDFSKAMARLGEVSK